MLQQTDTIYLESSTEPAGDTVVHHGNWQPTPAQVLSWLSSGATPYEQDSAVQSRIKPAEITWSERPDTLHLPGLPADQDVRAANTSPFFRESYFDGHEHFIEEVFGGEPGEPGEPVPYSMARDNIITALLILCFVISAVSLRRSWQFMFRQTKELFRARRDDEAPMTETSDEFGFQFFLVLQTSLLLGVMYFFYVQAGGVDTFMTDQHVVIGIYAAAYLMLVIIRTMGYLVVGAVFFNRRSNEIWMKSLLYLLSVEGLLLFPVVVLQVYFGMGAYTSFKCCLVIAVVFRILSFYKTYIIFFSQKKAVMQNILYFCALEIIPLGALWGVLSAITDSLEVNF